MPENGYVTPREFQSAVNRLDGRMDKLDEKIDGVNDCMVKLKTKFNDELEQTVRKEKWKYGISMALLSGVVSFAVATVI